MACTTSSSGSLLPTASDPGVAASGKLAIRSAAPRTGQPRHPVLQAEAVKIEGTNPTTRTESIVQIPAGRPPRRSPQGQSVPSASEQPGRALRRWLVRSALSVCHHQMTTAGRLPHFEGVEGAAGELDSDLAEEPAAAAGLDSFSEEPESPFDLPLPFPPPLPLA